MPRGPMPDSNEDGALHIGESSSTRKSVPVFEMNHAEAVDGNKQTGGSVWGEVTRRRADTQARLGFVGHRGKGTERCLGNRGKIEGLEDDYKVRFKS